VLLKGIVIMSKVISPTTWGKIIQVVITVLTALAGIITGSSFASA
jgi:hypothetical protein